MKPDHMKKPDILNFYLPGEYEPTKCVWLLWPHRLDNWRDDASHVQADFVVFAQILSQVTKVKIGVSPEKIKDVSMFFPEFIDLVPIEYDDIWIRDTAPSIIKNIDGELIAIDWNFNSWGGLFADYEKDNLIGKKIGELECLKVFGAPLTLEGGAIITDGNGTLFCTKESVLSDNRNFGLTLKEAEDYFRSYLNVSQVIWFDNGLSCDEAGGHIDNILSFVDAQTIVVASTEDVRSPNYKNLKTIAQKLKNSTNVNGEKYKIYTIPLPGRTYISESESAGFSESDGKINRSLNHELAPSYVNLCIVNDAVFVPIFGCETDTLALKTLSKIFTNKYVVPIRSREFLLGGGAIHCISKNIPL